MLPIFESILPVFLLLLLGTLLRRFPLINSAAWPGLEQLGYWFLYPSLLFITIVNADFAGLKLDAMIAALLVGLSLMIAFTLAAWPVLRNLGISTEQQYSSVFQTAIRWNGFIALAIAQKIFPPAGMAVVALVMAVIIIPINLMSVFIVSSFADRSADWVRIVRSMATNPLILASLGAILLRMMSFGLYAPLNETLDLVGRAALGMGLLAIGAGLRIDDVLRPNGSMVFSLLVKLAGFPIVLVTMAILFGVTGEQVSYLALCAAVPTAMNGYLLARQLGGDAELYAASTTLQTIASFFTIPLVLALTAQIAG